MWILCENYTFWNLLTWLSSFSRENHAESFGNLSKMMVLDTKLAKIAKHGPNMGPYGPYGFVCARPGPLLRSGPAQAPPDRRSRSEKLHLVDVHVFIKLCILCDIRCFSIALLPIPHEISNTRHMSRHYCVTYDGFWIYLLFEGSPWNMIPYAVGILSNQKFYTQNVRFLDVNPYKVTCPRRKNLTEWVFCSFFQELRPFSCCYQFLFVSSLSNSLLSIKLIPSGT